MHSKKGRGSSIFWHFMTTTVWWWWWSILETETTNCHQCREQLTLCNSAALYCRPWAISAFHSLHFYWTLRFKYSDSNNPIQIIRFNHSISSHRVSSRQNISPPRDLISIFNFILGNHLLVHL